MHVFFTETVIGNLDVSVKGQQDVVQFQITIDDAILVEVFESKADFCGVKPAKRGGKKPLAPPPKKREKSQVGGAHTVLA